MNKFGESRVRLADITKLVTVLMGPNGSGKSMSLKELDTEIAKHYGDNPSHFARFGSVYHIEDINVPIFMYTTSHNDIVDTSMDFNPEHIAAAFTSEGERMCLSFNNWLGAVWIQNLKKHKPKEYWMLLDELDSGLSLDRLLITILDFASVIELEKKRGANIHIVLTCNSYELLQALQEYFKDDLDIIWVPSKKKIEVNSYNDFRKLYLPRFNFYKKQREEY